MDRLLEATVYRWIDPGGDPLAAITRISVLILLVFAVKNVFHFTRTYLLRRAEQGLNRDLRNVLYDHLIGLDLAFFTRVRTGQIVSRLTTEIEQLRSLVTAELSKLLSSVFEFGVALIAMLLISWRLTLAAFIVIPAAMAIWGPLVGVLRRRDRAVLDLGGEVNAHISETLSGIRLVKASSSEERERARFRSLTGGYFSRFMRAELARALAAPMTEMLAAAGTVVLLFYGARLVIAGELTGPEFIVFLTLSVKLYAPVKSLAKFPAIAQPGLVAARTRVRVPRYARRDHRSSRRPATEGFRARDRPTTGSRLPTATESPPFTRCPSRYRRGVCSRWSDPAVRARARSWTFSGASSTSPQVVYRSTAWTCVSSPSRICALTSASSHRRPCSSTTPCGPTSPMASSVPRMTRSEPHLGRRMRMSSCAGCPKGTTRS